MPLTLPCLNRLTRIHQLQHIQGQIVSHPPERAQLKDDDDSDECPDFEESGPEKAKRHHEDVAGGVHDRVAKIAEGDGGLAVSVDDERRIFEQLPATFDEERDQEPILTRKLLLESRWQLAPDEPQKPVKEYAVDDM